MNLRDLQYLAAVAEHLHFGRAAQQCHVSQPTLSMQLRKLEDQLGVTLFERSNKRVMLTPVGAELAERARSILEQAQQMKTLAAASKDPFSGELRLGVFPTLAPYLLPTLVPLLRNHFPKLELLLVEEKTPTLMQQLHGGKLDAALLAMPVPQDDFSAYQLFEEPFLLAVSPRHALAKRKRVSLSELRRERMLLLEDGHCLREQALEVCHSIGMGEARHFRATSLETLRHMVAASDMVTLIPKLATQGSAGDLRYVPFAAPVPSRVIGLCVRQTSARKILLEAMQTVMTAAYKEIGKI